MQSEHNIIDAPSAGRASPDRTELGLDNFRWVCTETKLADAVAAFRLASRTDRDAWHALNCGLARANEDGSHGGSFHSDAGEYCVRWTGDAQEGLYVFGGEQLAQVRAPAADNVRAIARVHQLDTLMDAAHQTDRAYVATAHALALVKPHGTNEAMLKHAAIVEARAFGLADVCNVDMCLENFDQEWADYYDTPATT
jgi:hypothetical protein